MSADNKPRKHRHKRHYTFMIISGDSDGSTRRLHLNHFKTQLLAYCSFAVVLALLCYIIYSAMTIQTLRSIQTEQRLQIEELKAENSTLEASNETLITEEQQLRAALNLRLENEQQSAEEAETLAIPTGFPLTGTASMTAAVDDTTSTTITKITEDNTDTAKGNPIVLFEAASGSNIIATGTGTVLSVTTDAKFGNMVTIDHGNGYITFYRNSGDPLVSEGDAIDRGDIIFVVSDNTTLGYQIQQDDKYINPEELIEING
ncbi:MAG: peptidoglycan DD-metalloendopeptidase family protein [Butyrivibrio sp.]|uniref:murein hydrolase activator EnvC family protein n=1 Tax=Butyrivibrio sp. TaxID=28121 RepID=UPI001B1F1FC4|nr:peptidoglycan DD-metalloendopeptidase family protein [Butyrivibrio sp.]MBO6241472.1 peptidoglycan DD-metalloendopeptidase family protein [Butyrivibrio sp.]